jgi:hypothetical protein
VGIFVKADYANKTVNKINQAKATKAIIMAIGKFWNVKSSFIAKPAVLSIEY